MWLPCKWFPAGLALGINLAGLPWTVCGVMLADTAAYYTDQQTGLTASFTAKYLSGICNVPSIRHGQKSQLPQLLKEHSLPCNNMVKSAGWIKILLKSMTLHLMYCYLLLQISKD